jgi:hypothetical protein
VPKLEGREPTFKRYRPDELLVGYFLSGRLSGH